MGVDPSNEFFTEVGKLDKQMFDSMVTLKEFSILTMKLLIKHVQIQYLMMLKLFRRAYSKLDNVLGAISIAVHE